MKDQLNQFKMELGVTWVKAESGTSYLCPVSAYDRMNNPSEDDLKKICVNESENPQNN